MSKPARSSAPRVPLSPAGAEGGVSTATLLLGVGVIGLLILSVLLFGRLRALEERVPEFVVVDFLSLAQQYSQQGASSEQVAQMMLNTNRTVQALSRQGAVVLDARAVVVAPGEFYLPLAQLAADDVTLSAEQRALLTPPALQPAGSAVLARPRP